MTANCQYPHCVNFLTCQQGAVAYIQPSGVGLRNSQPVFVEQPEIALGRTPSTLGCSTLWSSVAWAWMNAQRREDSRSPSPNKAFGAPWSGRQASRMWLVI
jgi:hypothetical protein